MPYRDEQGTGQEAHKLFTMISLWPACNIACIPNGSTKRQKVFCFTHPKGTLCGDLNRKRCYLPPHSWQVRAWKRWENRWTNQYSCNTWGSVTGRGGGSQHDRTIKALIAGSHAGKPKDLSLNYRCWLRIITHRSTAWKEPPCIFGGSEKKLLLSV